MPHRASVPGNRMTKSGVLLVENDSMARNAWKKILSKSNQIRVIGEIATKEIGRIKINFPAPEIILTGFSFVERGLVRSEKLRKMWGTFPKIIVLCENKAQVGEAYRAHVDWAAAAPFNDHHLVTWVRALSADAKRLCEEYLSKLLNAERNELNRNEYYDAAREILQLLYHPDLVNPENIGIPNTGPVQPPQRLLFRNQAGVEAPGSGPEEKRFDEFWIDARQSHGAKYVTADLYNTRIAPAAISTLGRYLGELHGTFGLIVGRDFDEKALYPLTVSLFENERKAILLLDDERLQESLEYKAGGVNPACRLKDFYQKLIADASI